MNLIQTFRRLGQQMGGWKEVFAIQDAQLPLIKKLYNKNGLKIVMTSGACPEQYEIFKDDIQIAYYRLRHGEFSVSVPDAGGEDILELEPMGDGCFDADERLLFLNKAMKAVIEYLKHSN